ncbi:NAD-dependent aldehyde dehydrogenase [Ephemerocybe angulata]|uniref:NAD-dependent aldehyde dehydrogenase n=1 Tax=Ephemerocybe angulata TaxID=980116 RepID=A0A8H6M3U3_9AGAR|nr:NAD-dependent aldehyde dehydrogenase [Tulosesus angulatus]
MPTHLSYEFNTPVYKGSTSFETGLFIDGKFVDGSTGSTIDIINPATEQIITSVSEGTTADVDAAVAAAQRAYDTVWGLNASGLARSNLLWKLAQAMEAHADELSAIEVLDNGKTFGWASSTDVALSINVVKYYAGWADKLTGQTLEQTDSKLLAYTRHEPIGVVGQIIPWNFPLLMFVWKIAPALATGNTIVLKPSEFTPLTALRMCTLINESGFPPGVVNVVTGYGHTVGVAISSHMAIQKVAFTGSTLVGRKIMEAAARSNLKAVTLELGGKSPNIIFDDADLEQAVKWATHGLFWNHGQACCAGSRIFVQASVYDSFLERFTEKAKQIKVGDPFDKGVDQGPQISQNQFDRVMGYIESGKNDGAKIHLGGGRVGNEGYYIEPTIFVDAKPEMRIVKEEIFGPVGVVIRFEDEEDVIRQANDTMYGLAAAVFSKDINRAIETAHKLKTGTVWVNCYNNFHPGIPFGGFKQSGIGREMGEYALHHYTNVKAVHINLGNVL